MVTISLQTQGFIGCCYLVTQRFIVTFSFQHKLFLGYGLICHEEILFISLLVNSFNNCYLFNAKDIMVISAPTVLRVLLITINNDSWQLLSHKKQAFQANC